MNIAFLIKIFSITSCGLALRSLIIYASGLAAGSPFAKDKQLRADDSYFLLSIFSTMAVIATVFLPISASWGLFVKAVCTALCTACLLERYNILREVIRSYVEFPKFFEELLDRPDRFMADYIRPFLKKYYQLFHRLLFVLLVAVNLTQMYLYGPSLSIMIFLSTIAYHWIARLGILPSFFIERIDNLSSDLLVPVANFFISPFLLQKIDVICSRILNMAFIRNYLHIGVKSLLKGILFSTQCAIFSFSVIKKIPHFRDFAEFAISELKQNIVPYLEKKLILSEEISRELSSTSQCQVSSFTQLADPVRLNFKILLGNRGNPLFAKGVKENRDSFWSDRLKKLRDFFRLPNKKRTRSFSYVSMQYRVLEN